MIKLNPIITFVTAFKEFSSEYERIQRGALYSWEYNAIRVLAADSEQDTYQACNGYENAEVLPGILNATDKGFTNHSPVLPDLIMKALVECDTPWLALINSDILITKDFSKNIKKAYDKYGPEIFITGTRYNINFDYHIQVLEDYTRVCEEPRAIADIYSSSDIFIASKEIWNRIITEMPAFILGRYAWDNWLHFYGELHTVHYNCTDSLVTLHANHDHTHIKNQEGKAGRDAMSSSYNLKLFQPTVDLYGSTVRINHWPVLDLK